MKRRDFFVRGALGTGAWVFTGCGGPPAASPQSAIVPAVSLADWRAVRAEFDLLAPEQSHMASYFLVSHPRAVRAAMETHRRGLDANPIEYVEKNMRALETAVRASAAEYLGAAPDDLAMTDSTTQGLGLVYGGLDLRPGQEIMTTTHDHIATYSALELRARRGGIPIRKVALYDDPATASADEIVARVKKALTPATRVVAITWVHSGTGVKLPLRRIADALADANGGRAPGDRALLFVDGVHGLGNQDFRAIGDLGCDFFVSGTHKWIFGPRGTGLVWARPDAWAATSPIIPTNDRMWREGPPEQTPIASTMTPGGFHAFEHRWALPAAFEMHARIGKDRVAGRVRELNDRCKQGLAKLPRVRLKTPMSGDVSAGIICFEVDGVKPHDAVARLAEKRVVASVTPRFYVPTYVRVSPSLVTLEEDVDRAVQAIATL